MEWILIFTVVAIVLVLALLLIQKTKDSDVEEPVIEDADGIELPTGTVINMIAMENYGYKELTENAPVNPPYSYFFFIVRYRSLNKTIRYAVAVSRGFEEPRIIKYANYDQFSDITQERIEKIIKPFDMFVDDASFNKLVIKHYKDQIIEIIKRL